MSSVLKNLLSQKMTNGYLVPAQSTKLGLLLDSLLPGGLTGKKGYVTKQAKNILFCCATNDFELIIQVTRSSVGGTIQCQVIRITGSSTVGGTIQCHH